MGAWDITERQSDHGMELLEIIIIYQLRKVDFATFNIAEASELLRQDTLNEIEQYKQRKRPPALSEFYLETLTQSFTHAAVLLAECLSDYYQTGEEDNPWEKSRALRFHGCSLPSHPPNIRWHFPPSLAWQSQDIPRVSMFRCP